MKQTQYHDTTRETVKDRPPADKTSCGNMWWHRYATNPREGTILMYYASASITIESPAPAYLTSPDMVDTLALRAPQRSARTSAQAS